MQLPDTLQSVKKAASKLAAYDNGDALTATRFDCAYIDWVDAGRVVVHASQQLTALLAATPLPTLTQDELASPYVSHAVHIEPAICASPGVTLSWAIFDTLPFCLPETYALLAFGGPGPWRSQDETVTCVSSWGAGVADVTELNAILSGSKGPAMASLLRVCVGLSRLIQSAPPTVNGKSKSEHVEIIDRPFVRKRKARSVSVRNVFAVEPKLHDACCRAMQGDRNSPAVRYLVRGHWRSQACGPRLESRKLIWIRPHWRGPLRGIHQSIEVRVR